jgi:hypothetical protein
MGDLKAALSKKKVESYEIGHIGQRSQTKGLWVSARGSKPERLIPRADAYWAAYSDAVRRGLK